MKGELPVAASRIPHALNDKLLAFAQETGDSRSKIVHDALSAYLGVNTPESAQSVEKRVAALERKLAKLMQIV
jgi:metal-responsive CopG/Arc/MetJ family transcriptional regulator